MGHKQATVIIQIHLLSTSRTSQEDSQGIFLAEKFLYYIYKFQTLGPGKKQLDMLHLSEKKTSGIFPAHLFPHLGRISSTHEIEVRSQEAISLSSVLAHQGCGGPLANQFAVKDAAPQSTIVEMAANKWVTGVITLILTGVIITIIYNW